ncbi:MAG: exo-alpha-sialidase [Pirellulales bacterium]|nr:exo-alpha-sialidase [Pirellulales bacterium]
MEHPAYGVDVEVEQARGGPGLERIEYISHTSASDTTDDAAVRFSNDNGRTWSEFQTLPGSQVTYSGVTVSEIARRVNYDPVSGLLIQPWSRIIRYNNQNFIHMYYRLSSDHGRTWTTPKMLTYEAGPDFNSSDPLNPDYLNNNNASHGQLFATTSTGHVVFGASSANDPNDPLNDQRKERLGALNFVGTWNPATQDYDWQAGPPIGVSIDISSRGLLETDVAELKDGRILDVWRGSNTATTAGHKWYSVSTDGGLTLSSPVQELKYDDGSSFYSPSSMDRLFRSQATGKLYWLGNITPSAPNGNSPRYPLVIAEVDEDLVALKKDTVTLIADRQPGEASSVQCSNFKILENPETLELELYMTNIGAEGSSAPAVWNANSYKYTISFVPEPSTWILLTLGVLGAAAWRCAGRRLLKPRR